jgi:uncharacterized protein YlxP (DUF503 family)
MIVGVSVFELHLPEARSLKEKRRVVKSLIERLHQRYRVSVAETDFHDLHQRAEVSLAVVGTRDADVERLLADVRRLVDGQGDAIVTSWSQELVESSR